MKVSALDLVERDDGEMVAQWAVALPEAGRREDGDADEPHRALERLLDRQAGAEAAGERACQRAACAVRVVGVEALALEPVDWAARRQQPVGDPRLVAVPPLD